MAESNQRNLESEWTGPSEASADQHFLRDAGGFAAVNRSLYGADDMQRRRASWMASQQVRGSSAADAYSAPSSLMMSLGMTPTLMQQQQQQQQLRMPSGLLSGTQEDDPPTPDISRIIQRLDAIAREEEEIALATARILEGQRRRNQQRHSLLSTDAETGDFSQTDRPRSLTDSYLRPSSVNRLGSLRNEQNQTGGPDEGASRQKSPSTFSRRDALNTATPKGSETGDDQQDETFVQDDGDEIANKRSRTKRETFPRKLHRLLNEAEQEGNSHIISWQRHGLSFTVHKPKEFVESIMPRYFPGSKKLKKNSFDKQLNLYHFKRVSSGDDKGSYFHEQFRRDQPELCKHIKRKNTNNRLPAAPAAAMAATSTTGQDLPVTNQSLLSATQQQRQQQLAHSVVAFPHYPEMQRVSATPPTTQGKSLDWLADAISKSRRLNIETDQDAVGSPTSKNSASSKQNESDEPSSGKRKARAAQRSP